MVKEPAGTLIITLLAELLNSELGDFDMTIQTRSTGPRLLSQMYQRFTATNPKYSSRNPKYQKALGDIVFDAQNGHRPEVVFVCAPASYNGWRKLRERSGSAWFKSCSGSKVERRTSQQIKRSR